MKRIDQYPVEPSIPTAATFAVSHKSGTTVQVPINQASIAAAALAGGAGAAIAAVQAEVDAEEVARANAVSAEQAARMAADTTLQTNITNEAAARIAGDAAVTALIPTPASAAAIAAATAGAGFMAADQAKIAFESATANAIQAAIAIAAQVGAGAFELVPSGDASGVTDTAALQAILNGFGSIATAISTKYQAVKLRAGKDYWISSAVIKQSRVVFLVNGANIHAVGSGPVLWVSHDNSVNSAEGAQILGPGKLFGNAAATANGDGIRLTSAPYSKVLGLEIIGCGRDGIRVEGSVSCKIGGNRIETCLGDGIRALSYSKSYAGDGGTPSINECGDNHIEGNVCTSNVNGISVREGIGNRIVNNTLQVNSVAGLLIRNSSRNDVFQNYYESNGEEQIQDEAVFDPLLLVPARLSDENSWHGNITGGAAIALNLKDGDRTIVYDNWLGGIVNIGRSGDPSTCRFTQFLEQRRTVTVNDYGWDTTNRADPLHWYVKAGAGQRLRFDVYNGDNYAAITSDIGIKIQGVDIGALGGNAKYVAPSGDTTGVADAAAILAGAASNRQVHLVAGGAYYLPAGGLLFTSLTKFDLIAHKAKIIIAAVATNTMLAFGFTSIRMVGCTDSNIIDLEIDGNAKACNLLGMQACTNSNFIGTKAYNGGLNGLIVGGGNTDCSVKDSRIPSGLGASRGIWFGNLSASEINTRCDLIGNHVFTLGASGIISASIGGKVASNKTIGTAGSGIVLPGANGYAAKNQIVSGNECKGNAFSGIQTDIVYTTDADLVDGCDLADNVCEGNGACGIFGLGSKNLGVNANHCFDNVTAGILLDDRADNASAVGNHCYDTRVGAARTQLVGIRRLCQSGSSSGGKISENHCFNNKDKGILVQAVGGLTLNDTSITGNHCNNNAAHGLFINETDAGSMRRITVDGNTAFNNATADIRLTLDDATVGVNSYATQQDVQHRALPNNATTPSVYNRRKWRATNSSATTITDFQNAPDGAELEILAANGNTTIQQGTIQLKGAANATIPADGSMRLTRYSGVWREASRSF